MSDATPMQQAILVNHTMSIQTYLTQLSTAISQLPTSVPLARIPLIGSDAFVALIAKPTLISWAHLLPLLETVWGKSAKVAKEHVTRGQTGVDIVAKLLETVGAAQLAGLEDEERDGAIAWIRALRDAVREKCATPVAPAAVTLLSPPTGVKASSSSAEPTSWAPPPPKTKGKGRASSARSKPAVVPAPKHLRTSKKHALLPDPSTSSAPSSKKSRPPPPASASSLSSLSDQEDVEPPAAVAADPKPSKSKPAPKPAPKPKAKPRTSTPAIPAPRPSNSSRPQRERKAPAHLDLPNVAAPAFANSPGSGSGGSHPSSRRYQPGEAVMAKFPNYSWWPAVIVDPDSDVAPPKGLGVVQGTWEEGSYMVKAIPTGGDWRWNPPSLLRPLPLTEISAILSGEQKGPTENVPPPPAWNKYRADLVEALLVSQDPKRLEEWAGKKTALEVWMEEERERKREARGGGW